MPEFVKDVEELRDRARRKIEEGAVTEAYRGDKEQTISILNEALATEIVCVLRYMHHYFMATGVHGRAIADEFKEHADAERDHADDIAERIQQLGGKPDYNPGTLLQRSASQYVEGETLADMIREDLVAERVVIEVYSDMIRHFADNDPTTRVMIEKILRDEEEHASDLADLLYVVDPHTGETEGEDPGTHPLQMHPQRDEMSRQKNREAGQSRQQRQSQETFAGRGSATQSSPPTPGTTGRPTRSRPAQKTESNADMERLDEGLQAGSSRAVRISKPNRKKRIA
jgi:bacterioferritin